MTTYTYTLTLYAGAINDSDQIAGGPAPYAVVSQNGVATVLNQPDWTNASANGINDLGQVVGNYYTAGSGATGFLYSNGTVTSLFDPNTTADGPPPNIGEDIARGINNLGQVVGFYTTGNVENGFLYSNGTYTTLDDPASTQNTIPMAINDSGQVVGFIENSDGSRDAFLYSGGTWTPLAEQLGTNGNAVGITNSGEIVGTYVDSNHLTHGFIYENGVYTTFDYPGATQTIISGINNNGQISGGYDDASGSHAFLATPDADNGPEPPTPTAPSSLTVPAGGSTPMGITVSPTDSDDTVSVTISGVPLFESITAPSGDTVTSQLVHGGGKGDTLTFTISAPVGQSISGLTLNSSFAGKGHPVNTFTVTASNSTSGETGTSAAQTITVTDPPASAATTPTFQQTTDPTGSGPLNVAIGDLNGDGRLDIVTPNANDNTVSVLLGNGNGTFQPQTTDATGPGPLSVAIGDLNGDGKPDLVVANGNSFSTDSVLLGNGDGTFQPQTTVFVGESHQVVIGDLNGDGKPDLVNANSNSGTVSVSLGNGDGTFQPRTTYAVEPGFGGSGPIAVAIADLNGDGKPDLVTADYSVNAVSVLLGNGNGTF
jgi:probable HAF family extracellular repeat protein